MLVVLLAGFARTVNAQWTVAPETTPPEQTEPPLESVQVAPSEPPPNGFTRRHRVGIQVGGTGIVQVAYRYRALGPVHLEAGFMGASHFGNVSAGVLVGVPLHDRWFAYAGLGGAVMATFGRKPAEGCDARTSECPSIDGSETLLYLHVRAGVGLALDAGQRHLLSLDVGGWRGTWYKSDADASGNKTESSGAITLPMAGLSYFFGF